MDSADRDYFLDKAEAEIDRANMASHGRDAYSHLKRAAFYLDCANDGAANDDDAVADVLV